MIMLSCKLKLKLNRRMKLNTINFKKSMKYNPFGYIRSEKGMLKYSNYKIVIFSIIALCDMGIFSIIEQI